MARQPTPAAVSKATPVKELVIAEDFSAANTLALAHREADANMAALATQLGYDGALTVGALEDGIRFYQQRTAEACLELGKRILLLKEASPHGDFMSRLELLGIEHTAAKRFMAAAAKFSKGATSHLLKVANSQSKLLELLVLDDTEMAELAEGGTVRGMAADDIANMGVRELRAALRDAKADEVANIALLDKKNRRIDALQRDVRRVNALPPDEAYELVVKESTAAMRDALGAIRGGVRAALKALTDAPEAAGKPVFMAGLVGELLAELGALREEFNLPDVSTAADAALAADVAQWAN